MTVINKCRLKNTNNIGEKFMKKELMFKIETSKSVIFTIWDLQTSDKKVSIEIEHAGRILESFVLPTYEIRNIITDIYDNIIK